MSSDTTGTTGTRSGPRNLVYFALIIGIAVVFASPLSDYITGVSLPVDGGNWIGPGINFRGSEVLPE